MPSEIACIEIECVSLGLVGRELRIEQTHTYILHYDIRKGQQ